MTHRRVWPLAGLVVLAACADGRSSSLEPGALANQASGPDAVTVCHRAGNQASLLTVNPNALAGLLARGDYVAHFVVDPAAPRQPGGFVFSRLTDAVLAARSTRIANGELTAGACRITIDVKPGVYTGSFDAGADTTLERFPIILDVPDISLVGALRMLVDADGRATGDGWPTDDMTVLVPNRPIVFDPTTEAMIVVAGHPGGSAGNGAVIEGFAFRSDRTDGTSGGAAIISLRVQGLAIRGNRFEAGLTTAADLRASSATVDHNYATRLGLNCAFCLAGPGTYGATGNRVLNGALGGIYVSPAVQHLPFSLGANPVTDIEPYVLPTDSAAVQASLSDNEITGHVRLPVGFAIRILALGPGTSQLRQSGAVELSENKLTGNTFGVIVDAGFPQANTLRRGDLDVTFAENEITGNCQVDLLVAFTRHTGALGTTSNPYLLQSNYRLTIDDASLWQNAWYANPDQLGNALVVNGVEMAPGMHVAYDPSRGCP